jgi:hypothetical protein
VQRTYEVRCTWSRKVQRLNNDNQPVNLRRVVLKALLLFIAFNLVFAFSPAERLGRLSLYNGLLPGRERFPFGENPSRSYNLSLYNVAAMFAAHAVAAPPPPDELRVFVLGDSSVWGTLLRPEETLSGQLNAAGLHCGGRPLRFFNLGYPTLSLAKDVMLLDEAMRYRPDLIVWLVTLESFPLARQLDSPIAANNLTRIQALGAYSGLALGAADLAQPSFWERTIIGQRRALADLARLQLYGVMWAATGIDQVYPHTYQPAQRDLAADESYSTFTPSTGLQPADLAFDLLAAGRRIAGQTPLFLVNEPILVSRGENSHLRYNFYYPRWAYDAYREMLGGYIAAEGMEYADLWDLVDESQFTNSAIHLNPEGVQRLKDALVSPIQSNLCP